MVRRLFHRVNDFISFKKEFDHFVEISKNNEQRFELTWQQRYPCLNDRTNESLFDTHYVYHTAWAARILKRINPSIHIDISSLLYFSTIVSAFIDVKYYDYRPANIKLSNHTSMYADLTELPFNNGTIESLSCMHVVEHIGLGRYGDKLDYDGDLKAIAELKRVVKPGGSLLFAVPLGKPKIMFNAHRIYSYRQIIDEFQGFKVADFSLIPDNANEAGVYKGADEEMCNLQNYACGCFWFEKI